MKKLEINKEDLKYNLQKVREIIKNNVQEKDFPKLIGVVKGNGMGLGLVEYSRFLVENNIDILAVSNYEEAVELVDSDIQKEILMLTPVTDLNELNTLISQNIILTIGCLDDLKNIEKIAKDSDEIETVKVHLKIDTGMGRYGVLYTNIDEVLQIYKQCEKVKIVGTFTHFSKPIDKKWTNLQFNRFMDVIEKIKEENLNPGMLHCCASTAVLKYKNMYLDAVRIGSVIQGRTLILKNSFKKVGLLKTSVVQIKELPKGYMVSYNKAYKTKRDTKIAIIPIGYMDGFNKSKLRDDFSFKNNLISIGMEIKKIFKDNNLKVIINNKKYKVIGKLGMYHTIIDITDSDDIEIGKEVIIELPPLQTNEKIRREYI